jgi:hypothetical protein
MIQLSPDFLPAQETLASLADAVSAQHPKLAAEVETKLKQTNLTFKER